MYEPHEGWRFDQLMADRSGFQRAFCRWLSDEPGIAGKVLDIGCGGDLPPVLADLRNRFGSLDGVDPDSAVTRHPLLRRRWLGRLEESDIPRNEYDLAYAYNVVEHVADPARFLTSVNQILRPGGVFWALTPHGRHPFCWLARITEQVGGKARARERLRQDTGYTVNAYPSYYRLNTRRAVERNAGKIGFSGGRFEYYPCLQWDTYFPDFMRWIPHAYDYVAGIRWPACMLVFAFRLQKQKLT